MSVYFAQKRQRGLIKIGWSRSVVSRLRLIKAKMIGAVPGNRTIEKALHDRFDHLHVRGEWFRPGDDLLTFINTEAQSHKPDSESLQHAIRLPKALLDRIDKIAEKMSQPGARATRTGILRLAAYRGVAQLEAEGKKR